MNVADDTSRTRQRHAGDDAPVPPHPRSGHGGQVAEHLTPVAVPATAPATAPVALITGSSRGIGEAIAVAFRGHGMHVVLNGRDPERLQAARDRVAGTHPDVERTVETVVADVSVVEDVQRLVRFCSDRFGRLDVVVNNAGVATRGSVADVHPVVTAQVIHTNLTAPLNVTWAALPLLRRSRGSVVYISSIAAFAGLPFNAVYSATKRALDNVAQAVRIEERPNGVHAAVAFVGFTENDPAKTMIDSDGTRVRVPSRRGVAAQRRPESVARAVVRMVDRKTKRVILGPMGRTFSVVSRLSPGLVEVAFRTVRSRIRAASMDESPTERKEDEPDGQT